MKMAGRATRARHRARRGARSGRSGSRGSSGPLTGARRSGLLRGQWRLAQAGVVRA